MGNKTEGQDKGSALLGRIVGGIILAAALLFVLAVAAIPLWHLLRNPRSVVQNPLTPDCHPATLEFNRMTLPALR